MVNCDIVIIDSGINSNDALHIPGICVEKINDSILFSDNLADESGHGTLIHSTISRQVQNPSIYLIKLSERQEHDELCLVAALEYIKKNIKCRIVNISLGIKSSENLHVLYDACTELSKMGIVVVSAFDNEGCFSYPAAFDCVIGVDNATNIKHVGEFDFVENSSINILAKGGVQRIQMQDGGMQIVGGASIACAHITAVLANGMADKFNFSDALLYLKSKSRYIYSGYKPKQDDKNNFFKVLSALVFPFAKEAHAFLRFADKLPFKIQSYCDIRHSGKVGIKLSSYYENAMPGECIMDIERIDFANIDTIILGHLDELNALTGRDYRVSLIKKAIAEGVNIYSFDPLEQYEDLLNASDIDYFYPRVAKCDIPQNTFGKLYKISKPVVGIFGTSSHQGKFSLQIALKNELEAHGYNIGSIGTEPHSLLFGMDTVFPMGYNSTVRLQNNEIVMYLNNEINKMCFNGKELVLVATQAQMIPFYCNNMLEFPEMQYHFALGTNPDAVIMCINYFDDMAYIRNSMYALMGLTDAKIVALVMYPLTYASDLTRFGNNQRKAITLDEFECKAVALQQEFQIPVFMLGVEQHVRELCQIIIDCF